MNLLQIRILVADFQKSAAFYQDILELKADWYEEAQEYALYHTGAARIELLSRKAMGESIGEDLVPSEPYVTNFVLNIEVPDIDAFYVRVCEKGGTFVKEPFNLPAWGVRLAHIRDVDGTLIEVYESKK
ncbi:VOC family protein [Paenibacillus sp. SYP-B3998]|uniref:VOC family protein n=1 Tax=Paenibacillus sp. SYP-B3998 TaxID=2678564 RepID=A0A6G4A0S3_9BACL|nr:VOC family protein [Paenibacillus sp. SYP-B3998]NEW07247.1 VOC family protein [Paenibacillus sp. SYP-B3998]